MTISIKLQIKFIQKNKMKRDCNRNTAMVQCAFVRMCPFLAIFIATFYCVFKDYFVA